MKQNSPQTSNEILNDKSVESVKKAKIKKWLRIPLLFFVTMAAFAFVYIFLLLGEPDEEQKLNTAPTILPITSPISPMEATDEAGLQNLVDAFGEPILCLYSNAELQKARLSDIPFENQYARMVILTYTTSENKTIQLKSIRPKTAAPILAQKGATLNAQSLYSIAGLNGSRMDTALETSVIAQNDQVVYCVTIPYDKQNDLTLLLRQTYLISPNSEVVQNQ